MAKYSSLFRNHIETKFEYRADILGRLLLELLGVAALVFVWISVFRSDSTIGGYKLQDALMYYLLIPLVGSFTAVDLADRLGKEIKDGTFSNYLIKPYKIWIVNLVSVIADKFNYVVIVVPIYLLGLFILSKLFQFRDFDISLFPLTIIALFGGLILHFALDQLIAWLAFWVDDVWSFRHFKDIVFSVLAGVGFPLDFLPKNVKAVVDLLPFKFFYYVPISYFTGKRSISDNIVSDSILAILWLLILLTLGAIIWKKGIKKYGAFGY